MSFKSVITESATMFGFVMAGGILYDLVKPQPIDWVLNLIIAGCAMVIQFSISLWRLSKQTGGKDEV